MHVCRHKNLCPSCLVTSIEHYVSTISTGISNWARTICSHISNHVVLVNEFAEAAVPNSHGTQHVGPWRTLGPARPQMNLPGTIRFGPGRAGRAERLGGEAPPRPRSSGGPRAPGAGCVRFVHSVPPSSKLGKYLRTRVVL